MFVRSLVILLLFAVVNCTSVYADGVSANFSKAHERNVTNMTFKLQEYLYEIQQNSSKIEFRVDSPIGDVWVKFDDFKGRFAMLDSVQHTSPALVDINAESLDTEAVLIGIMLKSESFLDVENFPTMRFVGRSFEWYSERQAIMKGEMTVQNTTRPVAFYVEVVDADDDAWDSDSITVKASTTIKRSKFGIHTLLPIVGDDVNVYMSINARKVVAPVSIVSEL